MLKIIAIGFITLIIAIYAPIFYCMRKRKRLIKLFSIISNKSSVKPAREKSADQAIKILHANKRFAPPEPIWIEIQKSDGLIVGYELLKAEIRFLLKSLDARRNQKIYLEKVEPNRRSEILKSLQAGKNLIDKLDFMPLDPHFKIATLCLTYRAIRSLYLSLPDEDDYKELNYNPLFEIIYKTSDNILTIFP